MTRLVNLGGALVAVSTALDGAAHPVPTAPPQTPATAQAPVTAPPPQTP